MGVEIVVCSPSANLMSVISKFCFRSVKMSTGLVGSLTLCCGSIFLDACFGWPFRGWNILLLGLFVFIGCANTGHGPVSDNDWVHMLGMSNLVCCTRNE